MRRLLWATRHYARLRRIVTSWFVVSALRDCDRRLVQCCPDVTHSVYDVYSARSKGQFAVGKASSRFNCE